MKALGENGYKWRMLLFVPILCLLTGCGKVDLLSNLPEKEANEIMSVMQQNRIDTSKKAGAEQTWTVTLNDPSEFSKAVEILNKEGFPNTPYATMGQVFQKGGLVSSPLEEKARFMYALSEDIAKTINLIPGVLRSRVHIVLPEKDAYTDEQTEATAAVFITYRSDVDVTSSNTAIKSLVANSIPGLKYECVSISSFPVIFENEEQNIGYATNDLYNAMGILMTKGSSMKFWGVVILLGCSAVFFLCTTVFFFISSQVAKKSASRTSSQSTAPQAVQDAKKKDDVNELDEEPDQSAGK